MSATALPRSRTVTISAARALASVALLGSVGLSAALAAATAERPSVLSPPTLHGFPAWLAGPLTGLAPGTSSDPAGLRAAFSLGLIALFGCWLAAVIHAPRLRARWTVLAIAAASTLLALAPPQQLTDLFNYIHYGRMAPEHGLNPYAVPPIAASGDPDFAWTNWSHLPSPYGPLFTLLSQALAGLSVAVAYWALKAILAAAWGALLWVVWIAARRAGRDGARALALVGLNPLVLVYGIGGAHSEPLMMLGAVAALAWPDARGGAAAVLGTAVKAASGALAPVLVLGARSRRWALAGALAAAGAVAAVVVTVYGGRLPALAAQSRLVSPLSVPNLLGALLGLGGATPGIRTGAEAVLALAVVAGCVAVLRGRPAAAVAGWVALVSLVTLAWVMPWYVLWVLPFAAISASRGLVVACVAATLYLGVAWAPQALDAVHALGFKPTRTAIGRVNHAYTEGLLH